MTCATDLPSAPYVAAWTFTACHVTFGHTSVKTTEIYLAHLTGDEQGSVRFAQTWGTEDVASAADD